MTASVQKELAAKLQMLSRAFGGVRDPRLLVLESLPDSVLGAGALLATVLGQDIGMGSLARLIRDLRSRLGDRLVAATAADWKELERACRFAWLSEWAHKDSLAGWVLSVSDFLRSHGPISSWKTEFESPKALVETMARELPWMGSRSPSKVKGWRLARWVVRGELGQDEAWNRDFRQNLVLPVAAVDRPLRSLGWLPSGWQEWPVGKRQDWFDAILREFGGDDSTQVWLPLETVLSRGRTGPACQEHLKSCSVCPVRKDCPSPGRS